MSSTESSQASGASRATVSLAEARVVARRTRVVALAADIRQKSHTRIASAGTLIAAFGVGVAIEQLKRRRGWRLVSVLSVVNMLGSLVSMAAAWLKPTQSGPPSAAASPTTLRPGEP